MIRTAKKLAACVLMLVAAGMRHRTERGRRQPAC